MKKNMLITGLVLLAIGFGLIGFALLNPGAIKDSYLYGFAGGMIGPGLVSLYRYIHWTRPENAPIYEAQLEEQRISLGDERKIMIRNHVGRQWFIYTFYGEVAIFAALTLFKLVNAYVALLLWVFVLVQLFGSRCHSKKMQDVM